jgi:hypothetical protein
VAVSGGGGQRWVIAILKKKSITNYCYYVITLFCRSYFNMYT